MANVAAIRRFRRSGDDQRAAGLAAAERDKRALLDAA
jgi:hypothetical protein